MTFLSTILFLALSAQIGWAQTCGANNANGCEIVFNSNPKASRALYVPPVGNPLAELATTQLSYCFYVFLEEYSGRNLDTLISYASNFDTNELMFEISKKEGGLRLHFEDNPSSYPKSDPKHNKWHHYCVTWNSKGGVVKIYFNGEVIHTKSGVISGKTLNTKKGYFILGQDQDKLNDAFEPQDGLRGKMSQVNVWDREITPDEVLAAKCCILEGNKIAWSTAFWLLLDGAEAKPTTAPCRSRFGGQVSKCGYSGLAPGATEAGCGCGCSQAKTCTPIYKP